VINKEWHLQHVLGKNATLDDRVRWHSEHVQVCPCHDMPPSIKAEIERRGGEVPRMAT
jgi:hypothetical protein